MLADRLVMPDLIAVARAIFPEGEKKVWPALAACADLSETRLSAIRALVDRARRHAS